MFDLIGVTLPSAGAIYRFQTAPFSEFSAPNTGRYAAFKVLGVGEYIVIGVLDGIWVAPPSLEQVAGAANSRDFLALARRRPDHPGLILVDNQNTRDRQIAAVARIVTAMLACADRSTAGRVFTYGDRSRAPGAAEKPRDHLAFDMVTEIPDMAASQRLHQARDVGVPPRRDIRKTPSMPVTRLPGQKAGGLDIGDGGPGRSSSACRRCSVSPTNSWRRII